MVEKRGQRGKSNQELRYFVVVFVLSRTELFHEDRLGVGASCFVLPQGECLTPDDLLPRVGIQWRADDLPFDFQTYPTYQKVLKI